MKIKIGKYRYTDKADYFIDLIGIHGWDFLNAVLDDKYLVYHIDPGYSVAVESPVGEKKLPFSKVLFFANSFAYEHEIPTHITPSRRISKDFIRPSITEWKDAKGSIRKWKCHDYHDALISAYESLIRIRHSFGMVKYKYDNLNGLTNIPYTKRYGNVMEEIALYANAIRQIDPLSEYLNYYRILERINNDNAKKWITTNIGKIEKYDFGFLEISEDSVTQGRRKNLFSIYKRRALKRINKIIHIDRMDIAKYLYNNIRCGIAHSKTGIKVFDFDTTMADIGEDNYIVKLLARIAIDSKSNHL